MTARAEHRVPGEDLPLFVAVAFAALGCVGAVIAVHLAAAIGVAGADSVATSGLVPAPAVVPPEPEPEAELEAELEVGPAPVSRVAAPTPSEPAPPVCPPRYVLSFRTRGTRVHADLGDAADALAGWVATHPDAVVVVEGHADAHGSEEENLKIAHKRARAVARALVAAGVPAGRVTPQSFGEYRPQPGAAPTSGRNRRVLIRVAPDDARCAGSNEETIEP